MPGWHLLQREPERVVPVCAGKAAAPACANWLRVDLEDVGALKAAVAEIRPDQVIHCGGVCDVAKCESHPGWAMRVNAESMDPLAEVLPSGLRVVYISSDHVFGGRDAPYTENDRPDPVSVYGRTKVEAEERLLARRPEALVVRIALSIGPSVDGKTGHLDWLRHRAARGLPMTIIEDEFRSAVHGVDLAGRIFALADSDISGIRHAAAERVVSRVELAEALIAAHGIPAAFERARRADRPAPHLGRVELATRFVGPLASALPSPAPLRRTLR